MKHTYFFQFPQVIFFYSCVDNPATTYGGYVYPTAAEVIGWLIVAASIIWIPVCALYKIIKEDEGVTLLEVAFNHFIVNSILEILTHLKKCNTW